ncbi:MAG: hypothetical protein IT170_05545 [Bryobacterales bacterium]|nr:hypothetical protein [Bryobacterales bacterium]
MGGLANKPYSGFLTWDSTSLPFEGDGTSFAFYDSTAYPLILDGIEPTKPIGTRGSAAAVFNDADVFEDGILLDGLALAALIDDRTPIERLFIGFLTGPSSTGDTLQLPADLNLPVGPPGPICGLPRRGSH